MSATLSLVGRYIFDVLIRLFMLFELLESAPFTSSCRLYKRGPFTYVGEDGSGQDLATRMHINCVALSCDHSLQLQMTM